MPCKTILRKSSFKESFKIKTTKNCKEVQQKKIRSLFLWSNSPFLVNRGSVSKSKSSSDWFALRGCDDIFAFEINEVNYFHIVHIINVYLLNLSAHFAVDFSCPLKQNFWNIIKKVRASSWSYVYTVISLFCHGNFTYSFGDI